MIQLLCVHAVAAVVAPLLFRLLGRKAFALLALAPASAAVWALTKTRAVFGGELPSQDFAWVPQLSLNLTFRLDSLSWLMVLIVGGIGALILIYCGGYFGHGASSLGRFGGVFVAFAGAMLGLVTSDNTVVLYLFWELTTVFSFLLIGHYHERQPSRQAAMQAIIVTTFGGLAMLAGIVALGTVPGGSFLLSELVGNASAGVLGAGAQPALVPTAAVLVLLGAVTKSAQVPFHFWLPAAMAAPTPVSAYLHAAAMVKAGIYLVARLAPGFSSFPVWQPVVLAVGLTTMIVGGYRSLRQYDLKLLLAFGTVSQLGFVMVLVGYGDRGVALAGLAMLAASMAGLPPMLGYVGKEAALHALVELGDWTTFTVLVIGSMLTVAYSLRFWWGAFADKRGVEPVQAHRLDLRLSGPIALLGLGGLVAGLMPGRLAALLAPHADAYPGHAGHLTLWSGFGLPLAATLLIFTVGTLLFVRRRQVSRAQSRFRFPSADNAYRGVLRAVNNVSADLTAMVQTGSLPSFLSVMLLTTVAAAGLVIVTGVTPQLSPLRLWDSPAQAVIVVLSCVAGVLIVRSRRRMKAVLIMAFVGYSTSLLFALQGAPDLALTQALVETVTLVLLCWCCAGCHRSSRTGRTCRPGCAGWWSGRWSAPQLPCSPGSPPPRASTRR